jgi:hypothetical protein
MEPAVEEASYSAEPAEPAELAEPAAKIISDPQQKRRTLTPDEFDTMMKVLDHTDEVSNGTIEAA